MSELTPEQRASAVQTDCDHGPIWHGSGRSNATCLACIAAAIREAEDAALERAARVADDGLANFEIAAQIRALKGQPG